MTTRKQTHEPILNPTREILCTDARKWLKKQENHSLQTIITGIPDMHEVGLEYNEYYDFFMDVSKLIMTKLQKDHYAIFIITDRKYKGQWIDKSFLLNLCAYQTKLNLMWHKIILNRDVGKVSIHRPAYSHMLCYSVNGTPGTAFPDLISCGKKIYNNATSINATRQALKFIQVKYIANTIIDPFVGRGTILAVANSCGFNGIGIDIDEKQCEYAKKLVIDKSEL